MEKPDITFIIPSIGRQTIDDTLNSLINQKFYDKWEALIIYDCLEYPPYHTITDKRISWINLEKKEGEGRNSAGQVRNKAKPFIRSDWVGFVDDDDKLDDLYMDAFYKELSINNKLECIIFRMLNSDGRILPPNNTDNFYINNVGISFAVKTELFKKYQFINNSGEDFYFLDVLRKNKHIITISPYLAYYVRNIEYNRVELNKPRYKEGDKILIDEIYEKNTDGFIIHNHNLNIGDDEFLYSSFDLIDMEFLLNKFNKIYFYNVEQLYPYKHHTSQGELRIYDYFLRLSKYMNNPKIEFMDYSKENQYLWKKYFNKEVNKIIEPKFNINTNIKLSKKNIDICILVNNNYRLEFCKKYLQGLNIININGKWGEERKDILKRSKVLINLHAGENYKILELFRINEALAYKCVVVSQQCFRDELYSDKQNLYFEPDHKIRDRVLKVLLGYKKISKII